MPLRDTIDILAALVAFDTTSRNSNLALVDWIETFLGARGVVCERVPDAVEPKTNLWATIGPADRPGYILSGHTDVVPVDGQAWTSDPFRLREADGRLYGRGTADMKGFVAACLGRVDDMLAEPLAIPLHLCFSYDEEVGCLGVRSVIARLAERSPKPLGCFVGEPTGMTPVIGHKGKRSYRAVLTGRACHSALAPQGVNAVEFGARIVVAVQDLADRLARDGRCDPLYDVPFSTAHTGIMRGGTALNIVPDSCEIVFETRTLPEDDDLALGAEIAAVVHATEAAMRRRWPGAAIAFGETSHLPGLATAEDAEVVILAKRLAGRNDHAKVAYGTEGGLFQSMAGIPTVVIGPGSIGEAHQPDEFLSVEELARCDDFLGRLIEHCRA